MSAFARYAGMSCVLLGASVPAARAIEWRYGQAAARRFVAGMGGALVTQDALVGLAVWESRDRGSSCRKHSLTLVDLLTLSRGGAAALLTGMITSGIRDRGGLAGWMGWLALLYGAVLCDWLDGPMARHLGTSELGALLDLEADSWLTLCVAASAVTWGDLPPSVMMPPALRYIFLFEALPTIPYSELHADQPGWVRHLGIAQMLLFIAALAPFGGRATRFAVRWALPIVTPLQVGGQVLQWRRRRG